MSEYVWSSQSSVFIKWDEAYSGVFSVLLRLPYVPLATERASKQYLSYLKLMQLKTPNE